MNIGIVTIAYNGYGKFLPQWCESIAALETPPTVVTVVLGYRHGLTDKMRERSLALLPNLKIVDNHGGSQMGALRNVAVKNTKTEWIQYLSVDDVILPWAIDEYAKYEKDADFISIKWQSIATWIPNYEPRTHASRIPEEMATQQAGKGFVVNHSPYRRSFWERSPYMPHDYPNAPFVAGLVELGARFVKTERPCTVYLRRLDSHCGKNLGRRRINGKLQIVASEKKQAKFWKADTERRIREYYGVD